MRFLAALLFLTALASPAWAQEPEYDYLIRPGVGIGTLNLGLTLQEAIELEGKPYGSEDHKTHYEGLQFIGHEPHNYVHFVLNFDKLVEFKAGKKKGRSHPIYRLYFRDNKLVSFIVVGFKYPKEMIEAVHWKDLTLSTAEKDIIDLVGEPDMIVDNSSEFQNYHYYYYLKKGVTLITHKGEMFAAEIFEPLSAEQIKLMREKADPNTIHKD